MKFALNAVRFEDVRQQVIDFLTEKGEYSAQFDFKGSNLAYVIDSMAYTTMLLSYHLSTIANNVFLDTTEIRKLAVSIAKTLGYRPKRKKASRIVGRIEYHGSGFNSASYLTISPKLYFRGTDLGNLFVNTDKIHLTYESPLVLAGEFTLYQGEFKLFSTYGTGEPLQSFVLPTKNADENNIKIYVYPTASTTGYQSKDEWVEAKTFFEISNRDRKIFFVEEDIVNEMMAKIVFGNGIIGQVPTTTETCTVEYLETLGASGNGESSVTMPSSDVLADTANVTHNLGPAYDPSNFKVNVPAGAPSFGGEDNETLEEIKQNAPKYFAAAGRGVTANDFLTILLDYKNMDKVNIIGGDELYPGRVEYLGNSYITATPKLSDNFLSTAKIYLTEMEEREVIESLRKIGIIATKKHFIRPSYLYVDLWPAIELRSNTSAVDITKIKANVMNNLSNYIKTNLMDIGVIYRQSKIQATVDLTEGVVSSSLNSKFYFALNYDSFYKAKEDRIWLPVTFQKDGAGDVMYDDFGAAITTNFVKRNSTIVAQKNLTRDSNYHKMTYSIFNLPPQECSIYGKLSHLWLNRYIYNSDAVDEKLLEVFFQTVSGSTVMTYNGYKFTDMDGKEYQVSLVETGSANQWFVRFGSETVGTMNVDGSGNVFFLHTDDPVSGGQKQWLLAHGIYSGGPTLFNVEKIVTGGQTKFVVKTTVASTMARLKLHGVNDLFRFRVIKVPPTYEAEIQLITSLSVPDGTTTKTFELQSGTTNVGGTDYLSAVVTFGGTAFGTVLMKPGVTLVADIDASLSYDSRPSAANVGDTYRVAVAGNFYQGIDSTWYDVDEYVQWNGTAWVKVVPFTFTKAPFVTAVDPGCDQVLNSLGMDSDVFFSGTVLKAYDFYHGADIATFNYKNGEVFFGKMIEGRMNSTTAVVATMRDFFNNYGYGTAFADLITILPDDAYVNGIQMGHLVDFDTRFNQKIIVNVNPIETKQV